MNEHRGAVGRWIAYSVAFLIAYFFSAGVFANFPLMGCVPDIIPVAIAIAAVLEGSFPGAVYGLCLGLYGLLAQTNAGPSLILLGTLIGLISGLFCRLRSRRPLLPSLISSLLGLALWELPRVLSGFYSGTGSVETLLHIALFEALYSLLLAIPTYFLFRFVHRRFSTD